MLDKVNLSVEKGSICGLVGRNGSGKTMLMKCICGFIPVTEGEILVNNQKVGVKDKFAENLGFIIETPGFMQIIQHTNLEFLSSINSKVNKQRIREVIELVGLDPDVKVGVFSGMNRLDAGNLKSGLCSDDRSWLLWDNQKLSHRQENFLAVSGD
ncbi:MAG: ATP-binding cassette domain-containing protein [Eubacterium ventriosum]|uniref:ATP-binding cassette domain-containing protein n=1 Tax=Eubacterium ventriosum TaxID=39496 RepID=UPI00300EA1CF